MSPTTTSTTISCWDGVFTRNACCFGPNGNNACWVPDLGLTYDKCCNASHLVYVSTRLYDSVSENGGQIKGLFTQCEQAFKFNLKSGRLVSKFLLFSGDPIRGTLHDGESHRADHRLCQEELGGIVWVVNAELTSNAQSRSYGAPVDFSSELCMPATCEHAEVLRLAGAWLTARLDAFHIATRSQVSVRKYHHTSHPAHPAFYVFIAFGATTLLVGLCDKAVVGSRQRRLWMSLSAKRAYDELALSTGSRDELFEIHCLRVTCTCAQVLNHWGLIRYGMSSDGWLSMLRVLQWFMPGFFIISVILLAGAFTPGEVGYARLSHRFFRKMQRHMAISLLYLIVERAVFPALRNGPPLQLPNKLVSYGRSSDTGWLNGLLLMEWVSLQGWQWAMETWQWITVAMLLIAESAGPKCRKLVYFTLSFLALPRLWDLGTDQPLNRQEQMADGAPRNIPRKMVFWSIRLPFVLLSVPILLRRPAWMQRRPVLGLALGVGSASAIALHTTTGLPVVEDMMLFVPIVFILSDRFGLARQQTEQADGTDDLTRRLIIVASKLSPLVTIFEGRFRFLFSYWCPPSRSIDTDWRCLLLLQGPIYIVWLHVIVLPFWVFYFRPATNLMLSLGSLLPSGAVEKYFVPCILAALGHIVWLNGGVTGSYFYQPWTRLLELVQEGTLSNHIWRRNSML
eukprot:TRINITY_DN91601_c0_g1_i1.p1 TRINITY_DN91601_c0_g1~~TRINITY_DN91601_c0_g1_i1.p1  ORF type:complete len:776 (+),score=20.67 TRINITY_DN91601_c0_g1_i1:286-2328(+)